jgi:putative membrane protein
MGFFARMVISALGLWLASMLVSSVEFGTTGTLLLATLLLGMVNAVVRPVVILLTLPITVLTLGLFLWMINAAMLGLVAWMLPSFHLGGLGPALLASAIVSVTSWFASWYIGPRGRFEVMIIQRDPALPE